MDDRIREADSYPTDSYDWDYDYQARPRSKVLWGRVVILAVVLLLAFFLGRSTAPGGGVSEDEFNRVRAAYLDAQDQIAALQEENEQLQANTKPGNEGEGGTDPTPGTDGEGGNTDEAAGVSYTVGDGETLVDIASKCYGDPALDDTIKDANEIADATLVRIGDVLNIPPHPITGDPPDC